MTLTEKQQDWAAFKVLTRAQRAVSRAIPTTARTRPDAARGSCDTCPHGWKHHKHSGRCRTGCSCTNGKERAKR